MFPMQLHPIGCGSCMPHIAMLDLLLSGCMHPAHHNILQYFVARNAGIWVLYALVVWRADSFPSDHSSIHLSLLQASPDPACSPVRSSIGRCRPSLHGHPEHHWDQPGRFVPTTADGIHAHPLQPTPARTGVRTLAEVCRQPHLTGPALHQLMVCECPMGHQDIAPDVILQAGK